MRVHVQDESALIVLQQTAPDPLQAGRVIGRGVELDVPGDGLGPAGVAGLRQLLNDKIDLIDGLPLDVVGKKALVVGVGPFALFGRDPVVVDALHNFLAVDLQVLQPAGKGPMEARLGKRVLRHPHHGAVPAGRVAGPVILGLDGRSPVPAFDHGPLPGLGQGPAPDKERRDVSVHVRPCPAPWPGAPCGHRARIHPALVWQDLVTIKTIMLNYNGIIRTVKRMERAKADLEYLKHRIEKFYQQSEIGNRIITLRDSVQAALLIVEAALRNRVSRGAHYIKGDES